MKPEEKKYILENASRKSAKEIAAHLGIKERTVARFIEQSAPKKGGIRGFSLSGRWAYFGLALIFIVAVLMRIYPVIHSPEKERNGMGVFGDSFSYHKIAHNILKGRGFSGTDLGEAFGEPGANEGLDYEPEITRPPLYPLFLCAIYKTLGDPTDMLSPDTLHRPLDKVRIVQCLLDALVCLLVFFIVRVMFSASFWPALLAAALHCFNFYSIFYTRAILTETLAAFLIALATLFTVLGLRKQRLRWWCLTGAALGLTALTRPEYILFIPLLALFAFLAGIRSFKTALAGSLAILLMAALTIAPWTMRNYARFQRFIPLSVSSVGLNLFSGTFESNTNWTGWEDFSKDAYTSKEEASLKDLYRAHDLYLQQGSIEIEEPDRALLGLALERIRANPWGSIKLWLTRIPRLWYQHYVKMYRYREASGKFFIFYFVFAVYAFISFAKERIMMTPALLLFGYLTLIFLPQHIEPRYGVAAIPLILCLTALGLWKAGSRLLSIFLPAQ